MMNSLGLSNTQSVLLAGAIRIAQSLGLHRLGEEKPSQNRSERELRRRRKRETGRRIWGQLLSKCLAYSVWYSKALIVHSSSGLVLYTVSVFPLMLLCLQL